LGPRTSRSELMLDDNQTLTKSKRDTCSHTVL
jgi:hypothetical protein